MKEVNPSKGYLTQCFICKRVLEYTREDIQEEKGYAYGESYHDVFIRCRCGSAITVPMVK